MPRKAAEKAFALWEEDTFPFILARELGMTLGELDERMSHGEYIRWRAFYVYESAMIEFERRRAGGK